MDHAVDKVISLAHANFSYISKLLTLFKIFFVKAVTQKW